MSDLKEPAQFGTKLAVSISLDVLALQATHEAVRDVVGDPIALAHFAIVREDDVLVELGAERGAAAGVERSYRRPEDHPFVDLGLEYRPMAKQTKTVGLRRL